MNRPTVVQLGCCHEPHRCVLCTPPPPPIDVATLLAAKQAAGGEVRFFGGPLPSAELLEAAGPGSIVRVRPDLLDREGASLLAAHGVRGVELDLQSFHPRTLARCGRHYTAERIDSMVQGLREHGFELGAVIGVGLPGSDEETAMDDVARVIGRFDTVRLHPVLVFRDTGLWRMFLDEMYTPLTLSQALAACRTMLDMLESGGVKVIRVGQQPGPDELGRCVAGPYHSSFRELVESQRTLDTLRQLLQDTPRRSTVVIRCASADETRTRGPLNGNVRTLRAEFGLADLEVRVDPELERGDFVLEAS